MKKFLRKFFLTFLISSFFLLQANSLDFFRKVPVNSQKLIPAGHWVYDAIAEIFLDAGEVSFATQSAPLSISELKSYLYEINFKSLSSYAKSQYNRVFDFFETETSFVKSGLIDFGGNIIVTAELYPKSNEKIRRQDRYFYKGNFLSLPAFLSVADNIYIESDFSFGKNYWASQAISNYFNLPINFDGVSSAWAAAEYDWPRTAYLSIGFPILSESVFNFRFGRGFQSIGNTQNGSILLSQNFETDFYSQLSFFSPNIKYTLDVTQVDVLQYMYSHKMEFRFFDKLALTLFEHAYVAAPFELRYLNPFMVLHGFSFWHSYEQGDEQTCAYIGANVDFTPIKNLRLYVLYAQNEIRAPDETDMTLPDSYGVQVGAETVFPLRNGALKGGVEAMYASPWLYIKHTPDNSLVRIKRQEVSLLHGKPVTSWMGTPFGPDSIAASIKVGYEIPAKWSVFLDYLFLAQGSNSFADLVFVKDNEKKDILTDPYYPATIGGQEGTEKAGWDSAYHGPDPAQVSHRITVQGDYLFSRNISTSAKISYSFVYDNRDIYEPSHIDSIMQHGLEISLSGTFKLF